jgi:transcriptional regulator with GAF, ATPase, and Fis domain
MESAQPRLSHGATLFLDEVGNLGVSAQPKLLRALANGEIARIGGEKTRRFDYRVLAATNHNLRRVCGKGRFRSDLYYRQRVLDIRVPPLRERIEDLPLLTRHFARLLADKLGCEPPPATAYGPSAVPCAAPRGSERSTA